jgi:hypothetical protein
MRIALATPALQLGSAATRQEVSRAVPCHPSRAHIPVKDVRQGQVGQVGVAHAKVQAVEGKELVCGCHGGHQRAVLEQHALGVALGGGSRGQGCQGHLLIAARVLHRTPAVIAVQLRR